ncbi:MAG: SRPBCC domain-containing protein, partial [Bacteroidetes bacterium]
MQILCKSPILTIIAIAIVLISSAAEKDTVMKKKNTSKIMHRVIDAWIDIDAQPEEVWEVLVDFKSWESWNSFIPMVEGNLEVGERLRIKVVPPDLKPMIFEPEVYEVIPCQKILWGGSFLKIIYRGDHAFLIEPAPDGKTRFRQIERFRGPMVLFMGGMI